LLCEVREFKTNEMLYSEAGGSTGQ